MVTKPPNLVTIGQVLSGPVQPSEGNVDPHANPAVTARVALRRHAQPDGAAAGHIPLKGPGWTALLDKRDR